MSPAYLYFILYFVFSVESFLEPFSTGCRIYFSGFHLIYEDF